jgi:hypothetical protein
MNIKNLENQNKRKMEKKNPSLTFIFKDLDFILNSKVCTMGLFFYKVGCKVGLEL